MLRETREVIVGFKELKKEKFRFFWITKLI